MKKEGGEHRPMRCFEKFSFLFLDLAEFSFLFLDFEKFRLFFVFI